MYVVFLRVYLIYFCVLIIHRRRDAYNDDGDNDDDDDDGYVDVDAKKRCFLLCGLRRDVLPSSQYTNECDRCYENYFNEVN